MEICTLEKMEKTILDHMMLCGYHFFHQIISLLIAGVWKE